MASTASGQCWALTVNCPVPGPVPTSPANRGYLPGFAAPLMAKDLGLAANAARAGGVPTELGLKAAESYASYAAGAGAGQDFSGILETLRGATATEHASGPKDDTKDGTKGGTKGGTPA